jgi:serine/threonine-protein kinase
MITGVLLGALMLAMAAVLISGASGRTRMDAVEWPGEAGSTAESSAPAATEPGRSRSATARPIRSVAPAVTSRPAPGRTATPTRTRVQVPAARQSTRPATTGTSRTPATATTTTPRPTSTRPTSTRPTSTRPTTAAPSTEPERSAPGRTRQPPGLGSGKTRGPKG